MPTNCTTNSSTDRNINGSLGEVSEMIAEKIQLYELRYHVEESSDEEPFDFGDLYDSDDGNDSCKSCDSWTCTNDFIFAVALVVNLGELCTYKIGMIVYIINTPRPD